MKKDFKDSWDIDMFFVTIFFFFLPRFYNFIKLKNKVFVTL